MAKAEYRSALRSRKLITNALVTLLDQKPLDKITVTDIVREADINRGTFYAHYDNVSDVVNSIFSDTLSVVKDIVNRKIEDEKASPEFMMRQVQHVLEQNMEFYRKIFSSDVSIYIYEQLVDDIMTYTIERETALSMTVSHEDFLFYLSFYSGGIIKLYRDWFAGKLPVTFNELTEKTILELREFLNKVY